MTGPVCTGKVYIALKLPTRIEMKSCDNVYRMNDDGEGGRDEGPKGELEYWRNRMQRLTSITEQLKREVCIEV